MEPFVAQLRELCAAFPTRAKWVFVPSHAMGRTLGDRLALHGTDWANLRFVTPLDIAARMGAPFLVERGIDPSEEGLGPALVMRLMLNRPAGAGYFRPLVDHPQMATALWTAVHELRAAGVRSQDLRREQFDSQEKYAELSGLLEAYEVFLDEHKRGDVATVFAEALEHPEWCPIQPADCWTTLPDVAWTPLQQRLIDSMPGDRITPAACRPRGIPLPRRLSELPVDRREPSGGAAAAAFFQAGGAEAEIEEVFRRVLASGRPLDDVEIICASPQHASLIWEKAVRYEWPITLAQGLPAALTRPGRALLAFAEWIEDDFPAGRLRRLLQSGDLREIRSPDPSRERGSGPSVPVVLSPGRAARLLVLAEAAWGRDTYRLALGRLAQSSRTRATRDDLSADERDRLDQRATEAGVLAEWTTRLVSSVPGADAGGRVDLQQLVGAARSFVAEAVARTSALDALAAASLVDALGDLRVLGAYECSSGQALRFLRERVEGLRIARDRPRPGHLHVSSFASAGWAGRPLVFVVGLEEGRVFPAPFEDAILLDAERQAIHPALIRSSDRIDEAVFAALSRLAAISAAGSTICLSYSCRDLREYRQTYASWVLLQVYRAASGNPAATYHQLHEALGPAKSCVPEDPAGVLGESRWWLRGAAHAGRPALAAVHARYPSLDAGRSAGDARASGHFTEFDGWVPDAGRVLDPCQAGRVVSPTQLEGAATCPFRHFVQRGLGVDAIESGERDRDVWLDALLRGTLLHDMYARLLRRCRGDRRRPDRAADLPWFQEQGRQLLDRVAIEMPPPSDEVRERELRLFLDDLELFLDAEASAPTSRVPHGFEVSFGREPIAGEEPLAQLDPVVISLGGGLDLRLTGQIDRIDRTGPATFEIVDYKTGGYWEDDWQGIFAGGTRLQHALYGLAAGELLKRVDGKARVAGAEYYFSSAKGQQERKRIPAPPVETTLRVLGDLRDVIASGLFVHAADAAACRWCDYGQACGRDAAEAAARKREDPRLAPYRCLVAHE